MKKAYGISTGSKPYEPAESELPVETVWNTPRYLETAPKLFEQLRKDHGNDVELLHDVHHRLTPIEAARLARDLEPYRLFWLEDATPAENQKSFELIRQHSVTPLAVGEVFNSIWDCKHLIENQLIDYIRTTIVHGGGITHLRRLADFAALHQVRTGFHGATDLSPVTMGAALHFDTWVPNFGIQEYMFHSEETNAVFPHDYAFRERTPACGRHAGARRHARREAGGEVSLLAQAAAGRAPGRRHDVGLVMTPLCDTRPPLAALCLATGADETPAYLNTQLGFAARAADLVSRMTLEEKVAQMQNSAPAIERLGVPAYDWWNEACTAWRAPGRPRYSRRRSAWPPPSTCR